MAAAGASRPRGEKAKRVAAGELRTVHSGRTTTTVAPPDEPMAEKAARLRRAIEAGQPICLKLSGGPLTKPLFVRNDYPAIVSHLCRVQTNYSPEQFIIQVLRNPESVSADSLVGMICVARWQEGEYEVNYMDELRKYRTGELRNIVIDPDTEDRYSPEA